MWIIPGNASNDSRSPNLASFYLIRMNSRNFECDIWKMSAWADSRISDRRKTLDSLPKHPSKKKTPRSFIYTDAVDMIRLRAIHFDAPTSTPRVTYKKNECEVF